MRVTLYEIAQATGVSVSTVSRVLNNDKSKPASKATTERIIKAAYDLGYYTRTPEIETYIPEPAHRNLTCFLASASDTYNDYFFSQLLLGIQEESGRMGYSTHPLHFHGKCGIDLQKDLRHLTGRRYSDGTCKQKNNEFS